MALEYTVIQDEETVFLADNNDDTLDSKHSSTSHSTQEFSSDLVQASKGLIIFLRGMHSLGVTLRKPNAREIERYEQYWLPLVASVSMENEQGSVQMLVPPADVAWLWHCHRLAPMEYKSYCLHRFQRVLDAHPAFTYQTPGSDFPHCQQTVDQWRRLYPKEPFYPSNKSSVPATSLVHGWDLVGSTQRQAQFLWHVSQPCYESEEFIQDAVTNYFRFLKLPQSDKQLPQIPTYPIDLVWHAHILSSITGYNADCVKIRGEEFYHDDSLDDRSLGSVQEMAFDNTKILWKQIYQEDYVGPSGNYRGDPPIEFYSKDWPRLVSQASKVPSELPPQNGVYSNERLPWADPRKEVARNGKFVFSKTANQLSWVAGGVVSRESDYVYGVGCMGLGFYSLETKDAFNILLMRVQQERAVQQSEYDAFDFKHCMVIGGKVSKNRAQKKQKIKRRLDELDLMIEYINRKLEQESPSDDVPENLLKRHTVDKQKPALWNARDFDDTFVYIDPSTYNFASGLVNVFGNHHYCHASKFDAGVTMR
jgi:hypothetical protein